MHCANSILDFIDSFCQLRQKVPAMSLPYLLAASLMSQLRKVNFSSTHLCELYRAPVDRGESSLFAVSTFACFATDGFFIAFSAFIAFCAAGRSPGGGHAEHERAAPGGAAGLGEPAGAPLSRAAPGGRILHLLKARRDPPGSPQAVLAEQEYQCKLCAVPITAATCELDHIVPVHQSFSAQARNLQALGLECHRNKTA
eukprot:s8691_g1.t1